jgi:ComF family protein
MLKAFLDLVFPRVCNACNTPLISGEDLICTNCRFTLPTTDSHLETLPELTNKFIGKVNLKHTLAFLKFVKGGKVQKLMHKIKYGGKQEVGELLGKMYGAELKANGFSDEFDMIIPVPLHQKRLSSRGYNQSDCLAKGLSEGLGIEWSADILKRGKITESQVRKSKVERFENVQDVFFVEKPEEIMGKRIVVIDDTLTTGATLEACVLALIEAQAKEVSIIAMAMVI